MSARPRRRVSGSTARLVADIAQHRPWVAGNVARRAYGWNRRDIHPRPALRIGGVR